MTPLDRFAVSVACPLFALLVSYRAAKFGLAWQAGQATIEVSWETLFYGGVLAVAVIFSASEALRLTRQNAVLRRRLEGLRDELRRERQP